MKQILHHLFLPHGSNNHRAKVLHHSSVLFLIAFFFFGQFLLTYIKVDYPAVLGSSIDISTQQLLDLTNNDRAKVNLPALRLDPVLSYAASLKANYMFEKNFWAHNSPDGITPWYFFKKAGYTYVYAGENLARGFTDSSEVVTAWMNSPTHRENMLSPNYKDVGFAIKKGRLLGEDTTLVVELFGSKDTVVDHEESVSQSKQISTLPASVGAPSSVTSSIQKLALGGYTYTIKETSLVSSRFISSGIGFFILSTFILVLFLDLVIIHRKKVIRTVGHNIDHIFFFGTILVIMILTLQGVVL